MPETLVVRLLPRRRREWGIERPRRSNSSSSTPAGARRGKSLGRRSPSVATHVDRAASLVLVPGTDVLLAEPVLPLKSGAKLAQVVPFALEEQLAADVEDLHFAVGKREARPVTPVAVVVARAHGRHGGALRDAALHADAIYAETARPATGRPMPSRC